MSNDPKPLSKPYLATDMDYLKQYKIKSWEDGDRSGDMQQEEYSELQKPYAYDEDIPDDYSYWEWTENPPPELPPGGDIIFGDPDPTNNPCNTEGDCKWAAIIGPAMLDCGDLGLYMQAHVWIGCEVAPWFAAFGSWGLDSHDPENVYLASSGPISASVKVEDGASSGTSVLYYYGPGCTASMEIQVICSGCCEDLTISGDETVNQGATWTGTITPACPGASCQVSSNSGCDLSCNVNEEGSQVTVGVGGSDCGSFMVTVTDEKGGCSESDSFSVRINSGGWTYCSATGYDCWSSCHCAGTFQISSSTWYNIVAGGYRVGTLYNKYGYCCPGGGTCKDEDKYYECAYNCKYWECNLGTVDCNGGLALCGESCLSTGESAVYFWWVDTIQEWDCSC